MFSSEQKLSINGPGKEELQNAFDYAFALVGQSLPEYYTAQDGKFIFYWHKPNIENIREFPPHASLNTLVNIVWDYLKSSEAKESFTVKQDDIDGSVYLGWEIFIPQYSDLPQGAHWYSLFGVRHDWIYYHK